jgi:hypothetical protein
VTRIITRTGGKPLGLLTEKEIKNRFTYHAPKQGQPEKYQDIRDEAFLLACNFLVSCPDSRERALALTKLEEAVMWANAAIARRA